MQTRAIKTDAIRLNEMTLVEFLDKYVMELEEGSVVAITSKVVSLCEGRAVKESEIEKDELIRKEADFYLPKEVEGNPFSLTIKNSVLIPASGIDLSNTDGYYVMWPEDVQKSVNQAREFLKEKFGLKQLGVIITDSRTVPLRWGTTGVGLAGSGFKVLKNYIGQDDLFGRTMEVSQANVMDGLGATAVLLMGEGIERTPIIVMSDLEGVVEWQDRNPNEEELKALEISTGVDIYGALLESVNWCEGGGGKNL